MTDRIGIRRGAGQLAGFETSIVATRYGARPIWARNSLLLRRQREAEQRRTPFGNYLLPATAVSQVAPPLTASQEPAPAPRSILGFVCDRHLVVSLWTKIAYLLESLSAFQAGDGRPPRP